MRIWLGIVLALFLGGCREESAGNGAIAMTRDATIGARYGSAGPRVCSDRRSPTQGAITAAQAAAYVVCEEEKELVDTLFLVGDVAVTDVSDGWKFDGIPTDNTPDLDVTKPVHSITGRLVLFECNRLGVGEQHGPLYQRGTNCQIHDHPNAEGLCFRTMAGTWTCKLDDTDSRLGRRGVPPPA